MTRYKPVTNKFEDYPSIGARMKVLVSGLPEPVDATYAFWGKLPGGELGPIFYTHVLVENAVGLVVQVPRQLPGEVTHWKLAEPLPEWKKNEVAIIEERQRLCPFCGTRRKA